jgi:hypothetical protein
MFCSLRLTCVVAGLAASALVPSSTSAVIDQYRAQGGIATSSFLDIDSTGCIWTYADVSVTEGRIGNGPRQDPSSTWLVVFIYQSDVCLGHYLSENELYAYTPIPADAFRLHGALQSASLQVTVDVENRWTATTQPVTIDLTWTGNGDILRGQSNSQSTFPGGRYLWRSNGSSRTATPSGSITLQSMTLTGSDAAYGRLESGHSASTIIYNNRPN